MAKSAPERPPSRVQGRKRAEVDLSLVRWMARLTPTQRLNVLQDHVNLVNAARRAAKRN